MYVVVGAGGYLGSYIVRALLAATQEELLCTVRHSRCVFASHPRVTEYPLDIADREAVDAFASRFSSHALRMIILATTHHPDTVAAHFRQAWHTNITSLSYLINRCDHLDALYYASTDSVYGESTNGYHFTETDLIAPINPYGRQKAAAEQVVVQFGGHVLRYPFLIGKSLLPDKPHFYDKVVSSLLVGERVEMLSDSYRSSLDFGTASDLLVALTQLEQAHVPGILNVCGDQDLSKYDVGVQIADHIGAARDLIIPVTLAKSNIYATRRAASTLMDNSRLKRLLNVPAIRLRLEEGAVP